MSDRFKQSRRSEINVIIPEPDYPAASESGSGSDVSSRTSSPSPDYPNMVKSSVPNRYLDPYTPVRSPNVSPKVERRSQNVDDNKAYKLHLKNHMKYATVKNYANFSNCPICQVFLNGYTGVYPPPAPANLNPPKPSYQPFPGVPISSPGRPGRSFEPEKKYDNYLEETLEENAVYVKVIKDRAARAQQELTIRKNEFLRVVDDGGNWWACEDRHGNGGYVPKTFLQRVTQDVIGTPSHAARRSSEMPVVHANDVARDQHAQKRYSEIPLPGKTGWNRGHH